MPSRLVGAPPGYIGHDQGGQLTEAVRRRPYSVVLLDEVEKAHPDVFNILLQLLDDGRLTDSQGRTVDFRNAVVIMTSNLGAEHIRDGLTDQLGIERLVLEAVHKHFRPEFVNRIDDMIVFHRLNEAHTAQILDVQLARFLERLADQGLHMSLDESAKAFIVEKGYDPTFGARPLKRAIQQFLENPLARAIVGGEFESGQIVHVSRVGEGLHFSTDPERLSSHRTSLSSNGWWATKSRRRPVSCIAFRVHSRDGRECVLR